MTVRSSLDSTHEAPPQNSSTAVSSGWPSSLRWAAFWLAYAAVPFGVICYLSGNVRGVAWFMAFAVGMLLPAAACIARASWLSSLPAEERSILSSLVVILATPIWYYARRLSPSPPAADLALVSMLWLLVYRLGGLRGWVDDLRAATAGIVPTIPCLAMPLLFAANWAGYAVERSDGIAFYGLFPIDFSNLASVVSLIGIGHGLPPDSLADTAQLHYHWPYFAVPALLTALAGDSMRVSNALVLCNGIASLMLLLAIAHLARTSTNEDRHRFTVSATVAAVIFASMATYSHQFIGGLLHAPWLARDGRNHNLLTIVNSMTVFGNNTTALVMIACTVFLLRRWNESGRFGQGALLCLLLALLPAYSSTLAPTVVLALAGWFLLRRVHQPLRAVAIAIPIAVGGWTILNAINVLGGTQRIQPEFDGGRFVMNFGISSSPLWVMGLLGDRKTARMELWTLILAAGFILPTVFRTFGSGATLSDLSMKTASLMVVALTPTVARGIDSLLRDGAVRWTRIGIAAALLLLGLANTAVYSCQFIVARALGVHRRMEVLPRGYDALLDRLRVSTDHSAVLLDASGIESPSTLWPVSRAERRVLLPNERMMRVFLSATPEIAAEITLRVDEFRAWQSSGYASGKTSGAFATLADYLLLPAGPVPGPSWEPVAEVDGYRLYRSTQRGQESPRSEADSIPQTDTGRDFLGAELGH